MGKPTGFMEYPKKSVPYRDARERLGDFGEIFTPALKQRYPGRDWILTRILWLSGLEPGKNRLRNVDTMRRYIYLHGTPQETPLGVPGSHGCVRMANEDIIELFDLVKPGTEVDIHE